MRAFIIRPFSVKKTTQGTFVDFERVSRELIQPALEAAGYSGATTIETQESGDIRGDMLRLILEADLVVADITIHNATVFYELGIRHALRKRETVLLKGRGRDKAPCDLLADRYLRYEPEAPGPSRTALSNWLRSSRTSSKGTDSPTSAVPVRERF